MEIFSNPIANAFAIMSLFVAGLAIILYYLKRFAEKQRNHNNEVELRIVSRVPLSQKSQVVIVETEGKRVMLGVTESSITSLSEMEGNITTSQKEVANAAVKSVNTSTRATPESFGSIFKKNLRKQIKATSLTGSK
jgi:flagellar biosynthetic protein FliO